MGNIKRIKVDINKMLLTKDGRINSNVLKVEFLKQNKGHDRLIKKIFILTSFLDKANINERVYCIVNNIKEEKICRECEHKVKFESFRVGYKQFCSVKCSNRNKELNKVRKNTLYSNFGVYTPLQNISILKTMQTTTKLKYGYSNVNKNSAIRNKIEQTNKIKYGYTVASKDEKVKEKMKKTNIKRYGNICSLQNGKVRKKTEETNINKYGVEIPSKSQFIKDKTKKSNINKYGVDHPMKLKKNQLKRLITYHLNRKKKLSFYLGQIKSIINTNISIVEFSKKGCKGPYDLYCKKCNNLLVDKFLFFNRLPVCNKCNPNSISKPEKEIKIFLDKYINTIPNDRNILSGKELDVYIPDKRLAIEYDGLMWHSIGKHKSSMFNNYKIETEIKKKHLWKTMECKKLGIQLLHIFENEWLNPIKQNIWKNIIKNKIGVNNNRIYGRNTTIKLVSNEASKNFLNMYHLQGNVPSKFKIGLFDKISNELLSIMTFGKSRFDKNVKWELLRFATKNGINVIGGASKIFKYFLDNYLKIGEIIKTYADLRFSNGDVYNKLGFEQIGQSKPNYFYFKKGVLYLESRHKYQKHKLKDKLDNVDSKLTESENMYNNDYRKIYDCGNLVFVYRK